MSHNHFDNVDPDLSTLSIREKSIFDHLMSKGFITKLGAFLIARDMFLDDQREYCRIYGLDVVNA